MLKVGNYVITKRYGVGKVISTVPATGSKIIKFTDASYYYSKEGSMIGAGYGDTIARKLSFIEVIKYKLFGDSNV